MKEDKNKIYFKNPYDIPFGILSNLYPLEDFMVDGEKYVNVNNYIYAFLGSTPLDRKQISNIKKQSEVYNVAIKANEEFNTQQKIKGMSQAYKSFFDSFRPLRLRLIDTGKATLLFEDPDPILGTGEDNKGQNMVGKYLMSLREKYTKDEYQYLIQKSKEKEIEKIYKTYLAYFGLKGIMMDKYNDLKNYLDMSVDEIVDQFGAQNLYYAIPHSEQFTKREIIEKGRLQPEIKFLLENPKSVAHLLRKENLQALRQKILEDISVDILEAYIDEHQLITDIVDWDFDRYLYIQKNRDSFVELEDQLINLYNLEALDEEIIKKAISSFNDRISRVNKESLERLQKREYDPEKLAEIKKTLFTGYQINIPELSEIKEAENIDLVVNQKDVLLLSDVLDELKFFEEKPESKEKNGEIRFRDFKDPVYGFLSPYYVYSTEKDGSKDYHLFSVNGLRYPMVYHFIINTLIGCSKLYFVEKMNLESEKELINGIKESYTSLLVNPNEGAKIDNFVYDLNELNNRVYNNMLESFDKVLRYRLYHGIETKFNKLYLKDIYQILANTGDKILIYNDKYDPILGEPRNELGKFLMFYREKLKSIGYVQKEIKEKSMRLSDLTKGNAEIEEWMWSRTDDLINTLILVQRFLTSYLTDKKVYLTPELVHFVINNFYGPCFQIEISIEEKITNVPKKFYDKCFDTLKPFGIGPKGVTLMWEFIFKITSDSISILGKGDVIKTVDMLRILPTISSKLLDCSTSKDSKLMEKGILNELQICSFKAVYNIIEVIKEYITEKYRDFTYTSDLVDFAYSLILGVDSKPSTEDLKNISLSTLDKNDNQVIKLIAIREEEESDEDILKIAREVYTLIGGKNLKDSISKKDIKSIMNIFTGLKKSYLEKKTSVDILKKLQRVFKSIIEGSYVKLDERNNTLKKVIWYTGKLFELKTQEDKISSRVNLFSNIIQDVPSYYTTLKKKIEEESKKESKTEEEILKEKKPKGKKEFEEKIIREQRKLENDENDEEVMDVEREEEEEAEI